MKWIKANERLPGKDGRYYSKTDCGNYVMIFTLGEWIGCDCKVIEWLDESNETPDQPQPAETLEQAAQIALKNVWTHINIPDVTRPFPGNYWRDIDVWVAGAAYMKEKMWSDEAEMLYEFYGAARNDKSEKTGLPLNDQYEFCTDWLAEYINNKIGRYE